MHVVKAEGDQLVLCEIAQYLLTARYTFTYSNGKQAPQPVTTGDSVAHPTPLKEQVLDWGWYSAEKPVRDQMFFPVTSGDVVAWEADLSFKIEVREKTTKRVRYVKYWYLYFTSSGSRTHFALFSDANEMTGLGLYTTEENGYRIAKHLFSKGDNKSGER
jgi:hypothetical protein